MSKQGNVAAFGGIIGVEGSVELGSADLVGGFSGGRSTYLFIYFIAVNKWRSAKALCIAKGNIG